MKKIVNGALLAFIFGVWSFQADARLEKKFAPLNIISPSNQQNENDDQQENNAQQNIRNAQRQYFMQDVRNALLSRWTPIQRARISNITFPNSGSGSVEISVVMGQNVNVHSFQTNFTNLVTAIVDRLQEIVEDREFELEGLATTQNSENGENGVTFRPLFLQDPFDSEGDEEMLEEESEEPLTERTNPIQNTSGNQNPPVNQQNLGNQTAFDSESEENINFEEEDIDSSEEEGDGQNNQKTSFEPAPER